MKPETTEMAQCDNCGAYRLFENLESLGGSGLVCLNGCDPVADPDRGRDAERDKDAFK